MKKIFSSIANFFKKLWKKLFGEVEAPKDKVHVKPGIFNPPYPGGPPEPRPPYKPPTPPPKPSTKPKRFIFVESPHVVSFDFYKTDGTTEEIRGFRTEIQNTGNLCPPDYVKVVLVIDNQDIWPFDFVDMQVQKIGIVRNQVIDKNESIIFVLEAKKGLLHVLSKPFNTAEVRVLVGNKPVQKYSISKDEIKRLFEL